MKTLIEIPTLGDEMTLPGGIALRLQTRSSNGGDEFIVHNYTTDRETGTERHYWQGSYFNSGTRAQSLAKALTELARRAERATMYDTGGALDIEKLLGLSEPAMAS